MHYLSTRGQSPVVTLGEAVERGLAPDGGLYVPLEFPEVSRDELRAAPDLATLASTLLAPFFEGDALAAELGEICGEAFDFPVPLRSLGGTTAVLELFHGPTAAFKDFGARFLAATLSRSAGVEDDPLTILVATSGDTGGAVAAAFAGRPGFEVVVLYPEGMVSERQERQLTCWGGNVTALRVRGDFDACQRMVKEAFLDDDLRSSRRLTSANSISLGRLLPQMVYYAAASLEYEGRHGVEPGFIIPSGNLGNATACYWASRCGLPIREIALATNANEAISRFASGEKWQGRPTIATLATAMDVGDPSNMERLLQLHGGEEATRAGLRAYRIDDARIREVIAEGLDRWGEVWDPHTATAVAVREVIATPHWVIVATAHPAKFETVVEPLVGRPVEVPPALETLLDRPMHFTEIDPTPEALRAVLS